MPLGENPRPPPSGGEGAMESFCEVASAWRRRLPLQNFELPPPNKLMAGRTLDLDLGFMAAPSLVLRQVHASSDAPLLSCVVARERVAVTRLSSSGESVAGVEGAPSPRAITLPARGPVLPSILGSKVLASRPAATCVSSPARGFLLRLPPSAYGRSGEFDGRLFFLDGIGKVPSPAISIQQFRSWKTFSSSSSSTAGDCRPTSKVYLRPIQKLVKGSGSYSTSQVSSLLRYATALNVGTAASGFVPASELDRGSSDLRLDGGDREGPSCVFPFFSEVFSAFTRNLCVFSLSYGVLCNKLYIHRLELM
jgi:hypothetical protein